MQRGAAQSAAMRVRPVGAEAAQVGGRIGGNDPFDLERTQRGGERGQLLLIHIRRYLDEQRYMSAVAPLELHALAVQRAHNPLQAVTSLQLPKSRRVGRRDVDGNVIGVGVDLAQ